MFATLRFLICCHFGYPSNKIHQAHHSCCFDLKNEVSRGRDTNKFPNLQSKNPICCGRGEKRPTMSTSSLVYSNNSCQRALDKSELFKSYGLWLWWEGGNVSYEAHDICPHNFRVDILNRLSQNLVDSFISVID